MNIVQPTLIMMCGLPGAGKTTVAKQLETKLSAVRFCPDEIMISQNVDLLDDTARKKIEAISWIDAQNLLRDGKNVILEYGFWNKSHRNETLALGRKLGARVELHYLEVPFVELWKRVNMRNNDPDWNNKHITRRQLKEWSLKIQKPSRQELMQYDQLTSVKNLTAMTLA